MKKSHLAIVAIIVLAVGAYWFWTRRGTENVAINIVDLCNDSAQFEFRPAERKGQLFRCEPQTVGGVTKAALFTHPHSRVIVKKQLVPDNGRLRASIAVKEEAWTQDASDGVLFRFGVSDGRDYFELLNQHVDPRHNANDRGWLPIDIDLTAYAGQQVDLVFNTNTSLPRQGDNAAFDFAVWGDPAVIDRP